MLCLERMARGENAVSIARCDRLRRELRFGDGLDRKADIRTTRRHPSDNLLVRLDVKGNHDIRVLALKGRDQLGQKAGRIRAGCANHEPAKTHVLDRVDLVTELFKTVEELIDLLEQKHGVARWFGAVAPPLK